MTTYGELISRIINIDSDNCIGISQEDGAVKIVVTEEFWNKPVDARVEWSSTPQGDYRPKHLLRYNEYLNCWVDEFGDIVQFEQYYSN